MDVQATDVDGTSQVRIRHYHRVNERPATVPELPDTVAARAFADAQALSAANMSLEDVIEASKKVGSPALEAALDESSPRFNLNSKTLTQLARAGVSPEVIDLMIAQTFPDRFTIERASSGGPPVPTSIGAGGTTIIYGGFPGSVSMGYPYYDPYYSYYSYYSPFAYPYWGSNYYYNNYNYRGYPNTVIVPGSIGNGGGGTAIGSTDSPGMVVNGRGYTRVTPGSANTTSSGSSGNDGTAGQHTVTSPRGVRSTGGDSSGGSVSSSGYSSGSSNSGSSGGASSSAPSSGDSGGRTAQPR
jgi:hypothetical protein